MRGAAIAARLEDVAGQPLAQRSTAGTTTGLTIPNASPRSLYGVYTVTGTPPSNSDVASVQDTANSNGLQSLVSTFKKNDGRVRIASTTYFPAPTSPNVLADGAHAIAVTFDPATGGMVEHDEQSSRSGSVTPANVPSDRLFVNGPSTAVTRQFAAVYLAAHDSATRRRVLGWLSRRYATPPPA